MNKLIWRTEEEMQKELKEIIEAWKEGQSKDGYILAAEGKFFYKNIAFLIKVLRYFNHTNTFCPIMKTRISDCHAIVEYPEETEKIVEIISKITLSSEEFLFHDTLHTRNDKQTTEQQIEECMTLARQDIDRLYDGNFIRQVDVMINNLEKIKRKLKKVIKKEAKNERGKQDQAD